MHGGNMSDAAWGEQVLTPNNGSDERIPENCYYSKSGFFSAAGTPKDQWIFNGGYQANYKKLY